MRGLRFSVGDVVRIRHTSIVFAVAEVKECSGDAGTGQAVRDPGAGDRWPWYWSDGCEAFPPVQNAKPKSAKSKRSRRAAPVGKDCGKTKT